MQYQDQNYQDSNGGVHFLSAQDQVNAQQMGLPLPNPAWTPITAAQAQAILNPPMTLAQAQTAQVVALQAAYAAAVNAPVTFKNAAGVTSTYASGNTLALNNQTATQNLADCINSGAAAWTMGHWLDTNNVAQVFTFADLQGLAAAMEAVEVLDWTDLVGKVAAVQAATTVAAVQAITF